MTTLPSPGDTLITLRTCGDLRRGDVVTVSGTCADGEYLYLDGQERQAFRSDAFMLAVKRPWHAWADPEWERRARDAAEGFVKEGIPATACADHGARTSVTSFGAYCIACGDRIEYPSPSPAPVATEADALRAKVAALAQEYAEVAGRNMSYEMRRPRELLDYNPHRSPWRAREGSGVHWPARFARDLRRILRALAEKETSR